MLLVNFTHLDYYFLDSYDGKYISQNIRKVYQRFFVVLIHSILLG